MCERLLGQSPAPSRWAITASDLNANAIPWPKAVCTPVCPPFPHPELVLKPHFVVRYVDCPKPGSSPLEHREHSPRWANREGQVDPMAVLGLGSWGKTGWCAFGGNGRTLLLGHAPSVRRVQCLNRASWAPGQPNPF